MLILNVIIDVFVYKSDMLGSHIGGHNGGHIGFRGDLYIENYFWWLHCVGHGQKHIHRQQNCDFICNIHGVMSVLMYLPISVVGHFGSHFGGHIGFTGDL